MFKVGDKVRVINYGHPIFYKKEGYYAFQEHCHNQPTFIELLMNWEHVPTPYVRTPPKNVIWEDDECFTKDMSPELVGQEGVIDECYHGEYSIHGIKGKHAWYNEDQLELI
jgi:hypothetical protein